MAPLPLACTVRRCGLPLAGHGETRHGLREHRELARAVRGHGEPRRFVCPRGHSYDVARSGYINLLQPQDRRAAMPGDAKAVVEARAAVIGAGVGHALFARVAEIAAVHLPHEPVVVDLGSGTGDALATLAARGPIAGIGIDLSTAAAERAATRHPGLCWVVANADRRLPLLDRSVTLALSLYGRRNAGECARVLGDGGRLIVAVPASDDLVELRVALHDRAVERSREGSVLANFEPAFRLVHREVVRDRVRLAADALRALLQITYRGARTSAAARVAVLEALDVTLASDVFVFAAR